MTEVLSNVLTESNYKFPRLFSPLSFWVKDVAILNQFARAWRLHKWCYVGQSYIWRIRWLCLIRMYGKSIPIYIIQSVTARLLPKGAKSKFLGTCTLHLSCSHARQSSGCPRWLMRTPSMLLRTMPIKDLFHVQVRHGNRLSFRAY